MQSVDVECLHVLYVPSCDPHPRTYRLLDAVVHADHNKMWISPPPPQLLSGVVTALLYRSSCLASFEPCPATPPLVLKFFLPRIDSNPGKSCLFLRFADFALPSVSFHFRFCFRLSRLLHGRRCSLLPPSRFMAHSLRLSHLPLHLFALKGTRVGKSPPTWYCLTWWITRQFSSWGGTQSLQRSRGRRRGDISKICM